MTAEERKRRMARLFDEARDAIRTLGDELRVDSKSHLAEDCESIAQELCDMEAEANGN